MTGQNKDIHRMPEVHAKRILVPVANPTTATGLIQMAWKLADHDQGRVFALLVTISGREPNPAIYDSIAAVVEEAGEKGVSVELITRTAPSVARGILDAALELGVTLMVLGFQAPARGKIALGPIVESVARTTPCDLVVYRNPAHLSIRLEDIDRVVVPLDGSDNSKVAARLGLLLADVYNAQPTAIYVQTDPDLPSWFGLARIEASLAGLEEARRYQRQVIRANDIVSGIVSRCDSSDMVVLGFSEKSPLDRWIFGNIAQRMLVQAPGPLVLAKRATKEGLTPGQRLRRRWLARFSPVLTPSERTDVIRQANELSGPGINFTFLMFVSSLLAAFGLLQNSAAVIIGAMLVAPLMSPLMSLSVGLLVGNLRLMRTAVVTTLTGVLIGLLVAVAGGLVMPLHVTTTEMLARGEPSLLDMAVALASGAAGAYAMARRDIPAALAGVAIAAALVPPLCTAGLGIAFGDVGLASGAALLFLTNIVSISLSGAAVFAWLGLRPQRESISRQQIVISLLVLGLLALPLASTLADVVRTERDTSAVRDILVEQFKEADVVKVGLKGDKVTATIQVSELPDRIAVEQAEAVLESKLDRDVTLEITVWLTVSP